MQDLVIREWSSSTYLYWIDSNFHKEQMNDTQHLAALLFNRFINPGLMSFPPHEQLAFDELLQHYARLRQLSVLDAIADVIVASRAEIGADITKQKLDSLAWLLVWGLSKYGLGLWAFRYINSGLGGRNTSKAVNAALLARVGAALGGIRGGKEVKRLVDSENLLIFCSDPIWHLSPAVSWLAVSRKKYDVAKLNTDGSLVVINVSQLPTDFIELNLASGVGNSINRQFTSGQVKSILLNVWYPMAYLLERGERQFPSANFHELEAGWVWTSSPVALVKFHLDEPFQPVILAVDHICHHFNCGNELRIFLNGLLIHTSIMETVGEFTIRTVIRDNQLKFGEPNELVFFTPKCISPPGDGRKLGLAIKGFGIYAMSMQ